MNSFFYLIFFTIIGNKFPVLANNYNN